MTSTTQLAFPSPQEIEGYWDWDKIHAPRPLTPLAGDAVVMGMSEGFTIAQHAFGSPLALRCRMVNNYLYAAFTPDAALHAADDGPGRVQPRARRGRLPHRRAVDQRVGALADSHSPQIAHDRLRRDERRGAARRVRGADQEPHLHVGDPRLDQPVAAAGDGAVEFYNAEIQPADRNEAWLLLQGYKTKSIDAGSGLFRLSRAVKTSPVLSKVFELDPSGIPAALEASDEGKAFLEELRTYLEEFGWRSDGIYELGDATWREDMTIPLNTIQGYIRLGEEQNPELAMVRASERREELSSRGAREARFRSGEGPPLRRADGGRQVQHPRGGGPQLLDRPDGRRRLAPLLPEPRQATDASAAYSIARTTCCSCTRTRSVRLSARRWTSAQQVAQRRAAFEVAKSIVPPDHLGEATPANPDPFFVAIVDKMLGFLPIEPSTDPSIITGVAASPGTAQGTVKVVRTLVEASKLQQGDIMVCEMTVPTWVPLFATVRAVVADSGGILSHCAIVAREFGLPAVVGTRVGTTTLRDGMTITVDGARGLVRIDSR